MAEAEQRSGWSGFVRTASKAILCVHGAAALCILNGFLYVLCVFYFFVFFSLFGGIRNACGYIVARCDGVRCGFWAGCMHGFISLTLPHWLLVPVLPVGEEQNPIVATASMCAARRGTTHTASLTCSVSLAFVGIYRRLRQQHTSSVPSYNYYGLRRMITLPPIPPNGWLAYEFSRTHDIGRPHSLFKFDILTDGWDIEHFGSGSWVLAGCLWLWMMRWTFAGAMELLDVVVPSSSPLIWPTVVPLIAQRGNPCLNKWRVSG